MAVKNAVDASVLGGESGLQRGEFRHSSPGQFALFRIAFGLWLAWHFIELATRQGETGIANRYG